MSYSVKGGVLLMHDGKTVAKYSEWGSYPIFYEADGHMVVCPDCVQAQVNDPEGYEEEPITAHDANWEDPHMYCERCEHRIESAYADGEE